MYDSQTNIPTPISNKSSISQPKTAPATSAPAPPPPTHVPARTITPGWVAARSHYPDISSCAPPTNTSETPTSVHVMATSEHVDPTSTYFESTSTHFEPTSMCVGPTSTHVGLTSACVKPTSVRVGFTSISAMLTSAPVMPTSTPVGLTSQPESVRPRRVVARRGEAMQTTATGACPVARPVRNALPRYFSTTPRSLSTVCFSSSSSSST